MPNGTTDTAPAQNDPLGILKTPAPAANIPVQNDPLGLLKKKDGTPLPSSSTSAPAPSSSGTQTSTPSGQPSSSTPSSADQFRINLSKQLTATNQANEHPDLDAGMRNPVNTKNDIIRKQQPQAVVPVSADHPDGIDWTKVKSDKQVAQDYADQAAYNTAVKRMAHDGNAYDPTSESSKRALNWYVNFYKQQQKNGDAKVSVDNNNVAGLKKVVGFGGAYTNSFNKSAQSALDASAFMAMNDKERAVYAKNQQAPTDNPEYVGTTNDYGGAAGSLLGSNVRFLSKKVLGTVTGTAIAAAAEGGALETGGLSLEGLPVAASFLATGKESAQEGAMNETLKRYHEIKQANPNIDDEEAMKQASSGGMLAGAAKGIATDALLSEGGEPATAAPITTEAKSVLGNALKETAKAGVEMGGKSAAVTALADEEGKAEGVPTSTGDILNDVKDDFVNNATVGALLHGTMLAITHGAPAVMNTALKYGLATSGVPLDQIKTALENNEKAGNIPQGTADATVQEVQNYKEALDKIPEDVPADKKAAIADLIQKKTDLVEEQKSKDPSFKDQYQKQIDDIDNQIQTVLAKPIETEDISSPKTSKNEKAKNAETEEVSKTEENKGAATPEKEAAPSIDYKIQHRIVADESNATLDDMTKGGELVPNDFYTHPHYYADTNNESVQESLKVIKEAKGDPEKEVTVYRAVPKGVDKINEGDWISLSKKYAEEHGEKNDSPVISMKVKAKDVSWDGNDVNEFAYFPKESKEEKSTISGKPVSDNIQPTETFRTLDYGEHKGEPESKEAQDQIKQDIVADKPLGNTGEKFSDFVKRVIPAFKDLMDKEPNNTTLVTHSSVIKALDVWEDMGRPENMNDRQMKIFAEKYNAEDPKKEGNVTTFKGDNGNDYHVARHGETEDNQMSEFRDNNTQLTDKGEKQAVQAGQELKEKTGGEVPKIITSDLPRAIHTSNIIHGELNPEEEAPKEEPKAVGVSDSSLSKIANKLGLPSPEKGTYWSPEEYADRGRKLLNAGGKPEDAFDKSNELHDRISIARAHLEDLGKIEDAMKKKWGENSEQYKKAVKDIADYSAKSKELGTLAHRAMVSLQGERDLDTGSFSAVRQAVEEQTGKPVTPEQSAKVEELTGMVSKLNDKISDLEGKLSDAINKAEDAEKSNKTYTEKAKKAADNFRKLKNKPFTFKDENGNDIPVFSKGTTFNELVELGAKAIEKTGEIADGVKAIVDKVKDAEWYKKLSDKDKSSLEKQLEKHFDSVKKEKDDITSRFIDKKDNKFSTQDAKDVWNYAKKNYLDKGSSYEDMVKNVAYDLNLTSKQVQEAIATPKGARIISDEMYRTQYKRDLAIRRAEDYVKQSADPKWKKFAAMLPNAFFALKTFGHGTVGFITHAGTNIFKPEAWKAYWPNFFRQFKFAFGGLTKSGLADYQRAMENLKNDPQYTFWKRAGLAVDPKESYEEYQSSDHKLSEVGKAVNKVTTPVKNFIRESGLVGERGFNALKIFRLDYAKKLYNDLPDAMKNDPNTAKEIAKLVNHSSGTTELTAPKVANTAFFAPRLELSRWQRLTTDPAKAIVTMTKWKEATPAEKAQAIRVAKNAGQLAATYMAALAANSGLLAAAGSKQKINYTDPLKTDFLKFKVGKDKTVDVSGGMLSTFDFISSMLGAAVLPKKELPNGKQRSDVMASEAWKYGTGKLSPFAGTIKDVATQKDFSGNTMPFSNDKPSKGGHKLTWSEYLTNEQTPIPVAEFFKTMQQKGASQSEMSAIAQAALSAAIVGGTGAHIGETPKKKK